MSPRQRFVTHLANVLVGGTGLVYFVMKYLMVAQDEFAVVNHPWQPHVQHLHVLAGPLLVFAIGWMWGGHISPKWKGALGTASRSASAMVFCFAPLVASGYLLQISVEPLWRTVFLWLHLLTATLWVGSYVAHALLRLRRPTRRPMPGTRSVEAAGPGLGTQV
jgi:hypothetical protein